MNPTALQSVLDQVGLCIQLAEKMCELYADERQHMIKFDTNALILNNSEKEEKLAELVKEKKKLRSELMERYGELDPVTQLSAEEKLLWSSAKNRWLRAWERLHQLSRSSRDFHRHSLKNLDLLSDHLYRLLGVHPLYTAHGKKSQTAVHGKVVQGKY